ncbi:16S rRNA (guanine(966)-N(2))-methyltransferase RsmD [Clostridium formicaceticum]|uniref:16S rRNA (Guanine(966)-N(2))-methyltransferase RsmD n=1 Tax=Clostridium formicaceticum TaxID=1497 RepID=A0AAC9RPD3_9CLOT|nr:16S rRNA (guanine(966)-N(2))-methyltransferase RsmD [Clostridium formicaceticum]AOY77360.1 16S rRNA (guanine(966)-N(2))-methyltransferase RsmD [Clostridium formicaceticum]ARE87905.1 Ribosomal RNA small subunit methyltransferase D [Clostridium formicaceticum]
MRIIAGEARGLRLFTPKDLQIRPTSDRVKESIFNIVQNYLYDGTVIDLFSGTGNLGIEALSRKAQKVYFVDKSQESIEIIKKNLHKTNFISKAEVLHADVVSAIHKLANKNVQADIIFMDPPYKQGLAVVALEEIIRNKLLHPLGIVVVEHDKNEDIPGEIDSILQFRCKNYGNTSATFYKQKEEVQ